MFSNQASDVSLDAPCRALSAVTADKVESRFIAGSCSLREPNHLHVMRFHSEVNELSVDATIDMDRPIAEICCSPTDKQLLITVGEQSSSAKLHRLPLSVFEQGYDPDEQGPATPVEMEMIGDLIPGGSDIAKVVWRDSSDDLTPSSGNVLTLDRSGRLSLFDITTLDIVRQAETKKSFYPPSLAFDPHSNGHALAVSTGTTVEILDWRVDTSVPTGTVDSFLAHRSAVTDLDYNPNKPYVLATAGADALVKFWDLRAAQQPLLVARGGHAHWVTRVAYNPFHDQLVLSTSTDSVVNLWRVSTISSAPLLMDNEEQEDVDDDVDGPASPNVRVARYEHGDAVYAAAWGAADAWIYLTLGYDGKAVVHHVPSQEKYKILL